MTLTPTRDTLADFAALRRSSELELFVPGDPEYDAVRMTWNTAFEHRPLAVAVPVSASGVIDTVNYARERGLSVAIQSTGHGPTREARDAILINMWRMNSVHLDLAPRRAVVGGGAKWQAVLDVVAPHGLAPLLGSTPDVSAVGYTLGGGLGWLARKYGTSAGSVCAFEIVTADGRLRRASPDENPDLFWGLRGAGAGHLGVVTSMEIQLYPISEVYGGNLFYPAEMAGDVMRRWRDWLPAVPDSLTSAVTLMNFPPFDEVPPEVRGKSFVLVRGAFDGPTDDGEELMSYWRDWCEPEIDLFGPLPFDRIDEISEDPLDPVPNEGTGVWLRSLSDATIDELISVMFTSEEEPFYVMTELRHAGGALARGSSLDSAFGKRDAAMLLELVAITPTPELVAHVRREIAGITERIASDLTGGRYLNYAEGDDRRYGVKESLGVDAYRRLAAVKAEVDPTNLFDHGLDVTA